MQRGIEAVPARMDVGQQLVDRGVVTRRCHAAAMIVGQDEHRGQAFALVEPEEMESQVLGIDQQAGLPVRHDHRTGFIADGAEVRIADERLEGGAGA